MSESSESSESSGPAAAGGPRAGDFVEVLEADSLWDGEMEAVDIGDDEVLLLKVNGRVHAFDGVCPHQSQSLVDGDLEGTTLTCRAHEWQFDVESGHSINPTGEQLIRHDVEVDDDGMVRVRLCPKVALGLR